MKRNGVSLKFYDSPEISLGSPGKYITVLF